MIVQQKVLPYLSKDGQIIQHMEAKAVERRKP